MMHISAKGDYGLRAMLDLALHDGQGPILRADIASRQNIPEAYLVQLLNLLRKSGIVHSIRGPKGGHLLLKRPDELTVSEVLAALEGPVSLLGKSDDRKSKDENTDIFKEVWVATEAAINGVLSSVTFADLCRKHQARQKPVTFRI